MKGVSKRLNTLWPTAIFIYADISYYSYILNIAKYTYSMINNNKYKIYLNKH